MLSKLREVRWIVSHGLPVSSRKLHLGGYLEYWLDMSQRLPTARLQPRGKPATCLPGSGRHLLPHHHLGLRCHWRWSFLGAVARTWS